MIMFFSFGRLIGFKIYGTLFSGTNLFYPILVLSVGMFLKLCVHIPFLRETKRLEKQKAMVEVSDLGGL
jgi:hypothetical protein